MALVDLLTDLSNFNWSYENAGVNNSQISNHIQKHILYMMME